MRLTYEQLEKRLADPRNSALKLAASIRIRKVKNGHLITHEGHAPGKPRLEPEMRNLIGILGQTENHSEVAKAYGVTRQSVTLLSNGIISQHKGKDPELVKTIEIHKEQLGDLAIQRSMEAFGLLTPDRMQEAKARDLASIAKDAASVFEKLQPKSGGQTNNLQIVVQVPPKREVSEYDIVELN